MRVKSFARGRAILGVPALTAALTAAVLLTLPGSAVAAVSGAPETYYPPPSRVWTVSGHGNGHGHGLSQYGADGRALAGQTMPQIVGFYYPGAALNPVSAAVAATPVRVELSSAGSFTTILATPSVYVTGISAPLPAAGVGQFRLVPEANGLGVQAYLPATAQWQWVPSALGLPATTSFSSPAGALTLVRGDGTQAAYRGTLTAVRTGATDLTVNTLDLDDYVRGVAPNESPSSWPSAALQAQVVAARTYALFEVEQTGGAGSFDVCDTSSCQVYGGQATEAASTNAAVDATAGQILTYQGAPIFAQFSSSNGGWTADGGKPYLIAQADPYDNATTDPWYSWTRTVSVAQVASYFGLDTVLDLRVLTRTGHGDWGGEVTSVAVDGTHHGAAASVTATGYDIRSAMNLPLQWFTISNGQRSTPSAPTAMTLVPANKAVTVSWQAPSASGAKPITSYVVTVAGFSRQRVPATARHSTIGSLTNGRSYRVYVQAVNADGISAPAGLVAIPGPLPAGAAPAPALVSQRSSNRSASLYWAPPAGAQVTGYSVTVLGRWRQILPARARQVLLRGLPNAVNETVYLRAITPAGEGAALGLGVVPGPAPAPLRTR